jgi:hypothetical protein
MKTILDFIFNRKPSVSREELNELISLKKNLDINSHIGDIDTGYSRLISQRGERFSNAIENSRLNCFEVLLISGYADFMASRINRNLRSISSKRDDAFLLYEFLLNKALGKIAGESSRTVFVMYQCGEQEDELYDWYENRINLTVQFPNFLSSSRRRWDDFGFYLEISTREVSTGKYIGDLTNKEELEEEVTFLSNTVFRIDKVDRERNTIYLTECLAREKGNYILYDSYERNIQDVERMRNSRMDI